MDDKKQYEPLFPKDLDFLNDRYSKFLQVLASIDYQIDNSLEDKGPNPAPAPNGLRQITPELRRRRIEFLESTREKRVQGFKRNTQKLMGGLENKQQRQINDRFDYETSRNGFKEYSRDDLKAVRDVVKEDKTSFDYMSANHFNKFQRPDKSIAVEKENIDAWGDKYQSILNHYRSKESVALDKNEPEPGKEDF